MSDEPAKVQPSAWCVVANVTREVHVEGRGGADIEAGQLGLKHFAPGAKIYLSRPHWGDGGVRVHAFGRHRGGGPRLIDVVTAVKWLVNFRAKEVYSPDAVYHMAGEWTEAEARDFAAAWTARQGMTTAELRKATEPRAS